MLNKERFEELMCLVEDYLSEKNDNPNCVPKWHTLFQELLSSGYDAKILHSLGIFDL